MPYSFFAAKIQTYFDSYNNSPSIFTLSPPSPSPHNKNSSDVTTAAVLFNRYY